MKKKGKKKKKIYWIMNWAHIPYVQFKWWTMCLCVLFQVLLNRRYNSFNFFKFSTNEAKNDYVRRFRTNSNWNIRCLMYVRKGPLHIHSYICWTLTAYIFFFSCVCTSTIIQYAKQVQSDFEKRTNCNHKTTLPFLVPLTKPTNQLSIVEFIDKPHQDMAIV